MERVLLSFSSSSAAFDCAPGHSDFFVFRAISQGIKFLGAPVSTFCPCPIGTPLLSQNVVAMQVIFDKTKASVNAFGQPYLYAFSDSRACGSLGIIVVAGRLFALGNYTDKASFVNKSINILKEIGGLLFCARLSFPIVRF
jgi:hypothetical protein